jgi:predicted nucleotidyltransferase
MSHMALQSLLGSEALRRVVVHFAARPHVALHFRALERRLGLSRQSLKNALDTLEALGLVARMDEGRRAFYRAVEHRGWDTLREMIRLFASPAEVVGDLLRAVQGVRGAFIFGSAATGQMRPDSDIDVFVIGDVANAAELGIATMEAGMMLGREIDLKHFTPAEMRAEQARPGTSYVKRVLAGSTDWAVGSPEEAFAA